MRLNLPFKTKQGWRTIGTKKCYFRSSWEVNFARYLEWLKENKVIESWEYEPKTFYFEGLKRGTTNYKPDFRVFRPDGSHYWVEVKGYYDAKSKTKIKRFGKYFPDEELRVVDKFWFQKQRRQFQVLNDRWENDYTSVEEN